MLYSKFLLVIYPKYSHVYMSILNSPTIPSSFPLATISLFSVSLFPFYEMTHLLINSAVDLSS